MSGNGMAVLASQPAITLEEFRQRMTPYQARIDELRRRYPVPKAALLQLLWLVQEDMGWVPRVGIKWAAEQAEVSPIHAFSVVEFYTMYRQVPKGRWIIRVCQTMACHLQGAEELIAHVEQRLGIHAGETTADGLFSIERVECLAACGNGPAVQINDEFLFGPTGLNQHQDGWHPTPAVLDELIERLRAEAAREPRRTAVDELGGIVLGTGGHPGGKGACTSAQAADYAPPPPALKLAAKGQGNPVSISWLAAPELALTRLERSLDGGASWTAVGSVEPAKVPGPPGAKTCTCDDRVEPGVAVQYRVISVRGSDKAEKTSAILSFTATAQEAP
jgi:NADH:ubiquinone oxidoreductase subunit E